jgi:septal ring factor EnvC (AmiA/AmiB activator)
MRALPPLLFALVAAVVSSASASAQDVGKRLQEIERQIEKGKQKSEALEEKAKSLTEDLSQKTRARIEMAKSVHELEERMLDLEAEVATLDRSEQAKREALVEGRRTYGQLLVALERMSRLPPQAVIAYPAEPGELVRAAAVLRGVVPRIEGRAAALKAELDSLSETRARIADKRAELARMAPQLRRQRAELDKQVAALSTQQRSVLADRQVETQRLEKLSREAEGLRELFDKLEVERAERVEQEKAQEKAKSKQGPAVHKPAPTKLDPGSAVASAAPFAVRKMSEARGELAMPAVGPVTGQYGEPLQPGITRKGLDIETRPGAQVVAPYDGKVVFAGPFRAYGLLLIIEHSEGYHTLLAGMSRIDAEIGQWLLSGEPVGIMGQHAGLASDAPPSLYVELRRNGQPINPLPWLAARKGKANG